MCECNRTRGRVCVCVCVCVLAHRHGKDTHDVQHRKRGHSEARNVPEECGFIGKYEIKVDFFKLSPAWTLSFKPDHIAQWTMHHGKAQPAQQQLKCKNV